MPEKVVFYYWEIMVIFYLLGRECHKGRTTLEQVKMFLPLLLFEDEKQNVWTVGVKTGNGIRKKRISGFLVYPTEDSSSIQSRNSSTYANSKMKNAFQTRKKDSRRNDTSNYRHNRAKPHRQLCETGLTTTFTGH